MSLKKSSLFVVIAGIATFSSLLFMLAMAGEMKTEPAELPNKQGFTQAIFFLEYVESPDEVGQVLGEPLSEKGKHIRRVMDTVNKWDFIFMVFYPLLYAALFLFLYNLLIQKGHPVPFGRVIVTAGLCLSVIMLASDAYENIQLFQITAAKDFSALDAGVIMNLRIATRIKSAAISFGGLILAYFYYLYFRGTWKIILPLVFCVTAIIGFVVISASPLRFLVETIASIGFIGWLITTIHGGIWFFKSINEKTLMST